MKYTIYVRDKAGLEHEMLTELTDREEVEQHAAHLRQAGLYDEVTVKEIPQESK